MQAVGLSPSLEGWKTCSCSPTSRSIEIGFQAPNELGRTSCGVASVRGRCHIKPHNSPNRGRHQSHFIGGNSHGAEGCLAVLPNQACTVNLDIRNTGNAYNTFVVRETNTSGGFNVDVPASSRLLQMNQQGGYDNISITAPADAMAFTLGETTFELLDDTGMVVDSTTVQL